MAVSHSQVVLLSFYLKFRVHLESGMLKTFHAKVAKVIRKGRKKNLRPFVSFLLLA
jgi:hypothetical protein